jgi:Holliday junction DNA helicase RuvA
MIGRISGILVEKNPPAITVDVHGLGYEVDVPMSTFYNLPASGEKVTLHTHLIVREDGHFLYGFASEGERAAFRQLLKISGIGKKTAERLLLELRDRLPKTLAVGGARVGAGDTASDAASDIMNALLALGYNEREAVSAMKGLAPDASVSDGIRAALKLLSKSS